MVEENKRVIGESILIRGTPHPRFCVSAGMIGLTGKSLGCAGMTGLSGYFGAGYGDLRSTSGLVPSIHDRWYHTIYQLSIDIVRY